MDRQVRCQQHQRNSIGDGLGKILNQAGDRVCFYRTRLRSLLGSVMDGPVNTLLWPQAYSLVEKMGLSNQNRYWLLLFRPGIIDAYFARANPVWLSPEIQKKNQEKRLPPDGQKHSSTVSPTFPFLPCLFC